MRQLGFYEQKSFRPGGLALVLGLHAAAFTGLMLVKTEIVRLPGTDTVIDFIPAPPPPPNDPPPEPPREQAQQPSRLTTVPPLVPTPTPGPTVDDLPLPSVPTLPGPIGPRVELAGTPQLPPPPVRVEARVDPRYAGDLQPPYPPRQESAERDGVVRVRVTIGTDGRVKAIEPLSATNDDFWQATRRHALARWRFRPATLDGRPVESTKQMNVYFRIEA
jgi:protein TonB